MKSMQRWTPGKSLLTPQRDMPPANMPTMFAPGTRLVEVVAIMNQAALTADLCLQQIIKSVKSGQDIAVGLYPPPPPGYRFHDGLFYGKCAMVPISVRHQDSHPDDFIVGCTCEHCVEMRNKSQGGLK